MTEIDFNTEWRRSSPLGVVFFFERAVKNAFGNVLQLGGSVATLVLLWRASPWFALVGVAVWLALCAAAGFVRYWHFRFRQDERGVYIRRGVFKKEQLDVEYDRIQGINVDQSPIFRLLGLVTVRFDTAGSTEQEGHLPAVTREYAEALRARVRGHAQEATVHLPDAPALESPQPGSARGSPLAWESPQPGSARGLPLAQETSQPGQGRLLLALGNMDMLRIALTDPSVLFALVMLPALIPQYGDHVEELADAAMAQAAEYQALGPTVLAVMLLGVALAGLFFLLLVAVGSAFLRFHGYQLRLDARALRSRGGLLTRKEVAVETRKVQHVHVFQGPLMRLLGIYRLRALPAGSGLPTPQMEDAGSRVLLVPALRPSLADELRARIFGDEGAGLSMLPTDPRFTGISKRYILARTISFGVAPALLATIVAAPFLGVVALACLAWVPLASLAAWQRWRRYGYMHDDHGLTSRWGFFGRRLSVCLFRKVQGVTLERSPMQRRNGLATLHVDVASGGLAMPFIDYQRAVELRDYILYKAESSRLPWH